MLRIILLQSLRFLCLWVLVALLHAKVYTRMHTCVNRHVCMCAFQSMYTHMHTYVHAHTHTHVCVCFSIYIHTHIHLYTYTHTHTHVRACMCVCVCWHVCPGFVLQRALDGGLGSPSVNRARSNLVLATATALRATVLLIEKYVLQENPPFLVDG